MASKWAVRALSLDERVWSDSTLACEPWEVLWRPTLRKTMILSSGRRGGRRLSQPPSSNPTSPGFFPRKAVAEFPKSHNTADYLGEADADDGLRYYLKSDTGGRLIRASEWLGTFLAESVGIAAPHGTVIQRHNGDLVYGSRRIIGVADHMTTRIYLATASLSNAPDRVLGLSSILSSIYALDLFIFNDDRHLGNYLSVDDNGVRRFYAYDFSRSFFWRWPWQGVPEPHQNTVTMGRVIRAMHGFDLLAAKTTLDRIEAVSTAQIEAELLRFPADWLPPPLREEFIAWWSSTARTDRVQEIKEGVENGTYL